MTPLPGLVCADADVQLPWSVNVVALTKFIGRMRDQRKFISRFFLVGQDFYGNRNSCGEIRFEVNRSSEDACGSSQTAKRFGPP